MRRIGVIVALAITGALFIGAGTANAAPSKVVVGTAGLGCVSPAATTIQDGVNLVAEGGLVSICAGTYTEQVAITTNGITVKAMKAGTVTVQAPAGMTAPKAILRVNGATGVTIRGLNISGPGDGGCNNIQFGVRVDGGGSATITHNTISDIRDEPFSGCQNGVAIQVGRMVDGTTGTARIDHNEIIGFQKNGITVDNTGSDATITHNTITGAGPTTVIAQNGIQVSRGATAMVDHNMVSAVAYTGTAPASSTGVLLFNPGLVTVDHNVVKASDVAIDVFGAAAGSGVSFNRVSGGAWDGIAVDGTSSSVAVHDNKADGFGEFGIWTNASGNTFTKNQASGNAVYDIQDDSTGSGTMGTGNIWTRNRCVTSNPAGLC